jgi:AcrR family transcriptional regulator
MVRSKAGHRRSRRKKAERPVAAWPTGIGGANDGRHRRGEVTRLRLFDAMLVVQRRINDLPTAAAVAKQARVGLRTFYEHFPDTTAFYGACFDHVIVTTLSTMPPVSPEGGLEARIAGFVERRTRDCEAWAPIWRIALRFAAIDQGFRDRIARIDSILRARAQILYSPELAVLPGPAQTSMLDALMSLTDMEAWMYLREQCGRDVESARSVWRFSVGALFARAPLLGQTEPA